MPRSSPSLSWPTLTMASLSSAAMPNCQPPASASPVSNSVNAASIVRQTPTRKGIFSVLERGMPRPLPAPATAYLAIAPLVKNSGTVIDVVAAQLQAAQAAGDAPVTGPGYGGLQPDGQVLGACHERPRRPVLDPAGSGRHQLSPNVRPPVPPVPASVTPSAHERRSANDWVHDRTLPRKRLLPIVELWRWCGRTLTPSCDEDTEGVTGEVSEDVQRLVGIVSPVKQEFRA
jgi:hypothetical protein